MSATVVLSGVTSVRRAVVEDVPWIAGQLKDFAAFQQVHFPLFDADYAPQGLTWLIEQHVVFVAEHAGQPAGLIGGILGTHPFHPRLTTLTQLFWWVTPAHRRSRAGSLLIEAFVDHGKTHADWVVMSISAHSPLRERTLLKRGFHLQDRGYLLEV